VSGGDWHDPFATEREAVERERRRAEREAQRRERRRSLADKVEDAKAPAGDEDAAAPASGSASPPKRPPEPGRRAGRDPAATERRPAADRAPARPRAGGIPAGTLWARRGLAVAAIVGVVAVAGFAASEVIDRLGGAEAPAAPPPKPQETSKITIPEGLTREQIAELAKQEGIEGDYAKASKSFKGFDPGEYGAGDPPSLEGFLFPSTWDDLPKRPNVDDLISRQLDAFEANLAEVDLSYAKSKNLNVYDVLKIASMIEEEIQVEEERKLAAAVIYNRLKANDTLGIDATIRYYLDNYDEQLTESELAEPHPYNSRIVPGLPPTPIANPGLASIEAAANPARSDAYYFVVKPGTCGEHVFVETEEEFARAEASYQDALQSEGNSPTEC
jgi:UPF0755 protein